jgi:hypothetical protein
LRFFLFFDSFFPIPMHLESFLNNALTGAPLPGQPSTPNNANNLDGFIDPALLGEGELPDPSNVQPDLHRSRRRHRSELDNDNEDIDGFEERRTRLLQFIEESMDRHSLEGEIRNNIRRMAKVIFTSVCFTVLKTMLQFDLFEQIIELTVLTLKRQAESTGTAAKDFSRSHAYTVCGLGFFPTMILILLVLATVTCGSSCQGCTARSIPYVICHPPYKSGSWYVEPHFTSICSANTASV